eukprot:s6179_g5.t1
MLASVAMAVSCMRGQSWVKSSYGKRFPTVEGQEAHRLDHVRVVAFVIPDPRQSSCVWPRQNRYLRVSWDTRLRFLHTCWPTSVTAVLTLVPRPHACDQIFAAFQKTFYAHLQTLICGACFLRAAHAWPEEILRKAGPLKFRAVHHAFYGTGDAEQEQEQQEEKEGEQEQEQQQEQEEKAQRSRGAGGGRRRRGGQEQRSRGAEEQEQEQQDKEEQRSRGAGAAGGGRRSSSSSSSSRK